MGKTRPVQPVKLFVGVLTSLPGIMPEVEKRLSGLLGRVDHRSEPIPFDSTHYYDEEMGIPICRSFFGISGLILPDEIADVKARTNRLEAALAADFTQVARPANLDPGYLEQSKIVLVSTKNYYHRVYLAQGMYAEVTLHFEDGRWKTLPWTFPDFRNGRYDAFFTNLRNVYRRQLLELHCD